MPIHIVGTEDMPGGISGGETVQIYSAGVFGTGYILNERVKYTASTGMVQISTANTNRDGTGTLGTVLTGASNGTLIKTITIKAAADTTHGMVRIYLQLNALVSARLIAEVEVPATLPSSGKDLSFVAVIPFGFSLKSGSILKASTQNAEAFNIIAEGLNWTY